MLVVTSGSDNLIGFNMDDRSQSELASGSFLSFVDVMVSRKDYIKVRQLVPSAGGPGLCPVKHRGQFTEKEAVLATDISRVAAYQPPPEQPPPDDSEAWLPCLRNKTAPRAVPNPVASANSRGPGSAATTMGDRAASVPVLDAGELGLRLVKLCIYICLQ